MCVCVCVSFVLSVDSVIIGFYICIHIYPNIEKCEPFVQAHFDVPSSLKSLQ